MLRKATLQSVYLLLALLLLWLLVSVTHGAHAHAAESPTYEPPTSPRRLAIPVPAIANEPRLVVYDHNSKPRAYQLNGVFHAVAHNLSGDPPDNALPDGEGGNAGVDFPWRTTAGIGLCRNVETFTWRILPPNKPIVWWREPMDSLIGVANGHRWLFPVGTKFGEVLQMRATNGNLYTFEMRIRERVQGDWAVDILRPFPEAKDLANAIKISRPYWFDDPQLTTAIKQLSDQSTPRERTVVDTKHTRPVVSLTASEDFLPELPDKLVDELLTKFPFRSCLGKTWKGVNCFAPTAKPGTGFNIVPEHYGGTFAGNDQESCTKCHRTASMPCRACDYERGWYGHVPGNDENFSWYPGRQVSFNGADVAPMVPEVPGVLEHLDLSRHSKADYQRIKRPPLFPNGGMPADGRRYFQMGGGM